MSYRHYYRSNKQDISQLYNSRLLILRYVFLYSFLFEARTAKTRVKPKVARLLRATETHKDPAAFVCLYSQFGSALVH